MNFHEYRSVCHGKLIVPFLHTEDDPPPKKERPCGQVIICTCSHCRRMCSIKREGE